MLLDGDKLAALAALFIKERLARLPPDMAAGLRVGVVQTAYANGASTRYVREQLGLEVLCTSTGGQVSVLGFEAWVDSGHRHQRWSQAHSIGGA